MTRFRRKVEEVLWITGAHRVARSIHARLTPSRTKHLAKMEGLYSSILPAGSLVFDVGANVGQFSALFAGLGHRVVAVEPNPDCVRHIELSYSDLPITVVHAAVGAQSGVATLNVSDQRDDLCSLYDQWIPDALRSRRLAVAVVTLDALIVKFGMPAFVKIDVEGYEIEVLRGLSVRPRLVSFEFNSAHLPATFACLGLECFRDASFNFGMSDPERFELTEWVGVDVLKAALGGVSGYGDVFAHR
jgi:FkbM family methyltransferase